MGTLSTREIVAIGKRLSDTQWLALIDTPDYGFITSTMVVDESGPTRRTASRRGDKRTLDALVKKGLLQTTDGYQYTYTDLGRLVAWEGEVPKTSAAPAKVVKIIYVRWTEKEGFTLDARLPDAAAVAEKVRDLLDQGITDITIRQD